MKGLCALLACVLAAGCYSASRPRPERTTMATDAKPLLLAALVVPVAPAPSKDVDFGLHYDKAIGFYNAESYPEAIAEFEAAYAIKADPLLLYNIAQAYRKAGRLKDALDHYERFVHDAPNDDQLKKAQDYIAELSKKLEPKDPKPRRKGH